MFQFKQFSVDQTGCAMKINTDGVLLGALSTALEPARILDIGTGTGVIAMMLAQKFTDARIDAVEIDEAAAQTAGKNFNGSVFKDRLTIHQSDIGAYFNLYPERMYELIVSNPPFYLHSLTSPGVKKTQARHTDIHFFEELIQGVVRHLSIAGFCWLILPIDTSAAVLKIAAASKLYPQKIIDIYSYPHSKPHRKVICYGFKDIAPENEKFVIYKDAGNYSQEYKLLLQPYFINF